MLCKLIGAAVAVLGLVLPLAAETRFDAASTFTALVGQERATIRALAPGHLSRIAMQPPTRSLFQRREPEPAQVPHTDEVWLSKQPSATGGPEWECLTEALYFEARGEDIVGVAAVAEVILNRVQSPRFPNTVCEVVHQGTGERHRCQFSFTCDGRPEHVTEAQSYERMGKMARIMLNGAPRTLTEGAMFYHTTAVKPGWASRLAQTTQIGDHLFYRR